MHYSRCLMIWYSWQKEALLSTMEQQRKLKNTLQAFGVNVPDRINPLLHWQSGENSNNRKQLKCNYKELPVRWMLHNGYSVPPDMWLSTAGLALSSTGKNPIDESNISAAEMEEPSFAESLWNYIRTNVELHCHSIRLNFLKSKDLSNRKTPGILEQYNYFLCRYIINVFRCFCISHSDNSIT